ncbi:hypothetical protein E2320_021147 [Naja naja]|nr:hypothetical protein E2320_021147 [Naja naja]
MQRLVPPTVILHIDEIGSCLLFSEKVWTPETSFAEAFELDCAFEAGQLLKNCAAEICVEPKSSVLGLSIWNKIDVKSWKE